MPETYFISVTPRAHAIILIALRVLQDEPEKCENPDLLMYLNAVESDASPPDEDELEDIIQGINDDDTVEDDEE